MDVSKVFFNRELCQNCIVVRWNPEEREFSQNEIIEHLASFEYEFHPNDLFIDQRNSEPFSVLFMKNEEDAKQICLDVDVLNSGIRVNKLIGLNGLRLKDVNDILKLVARDEKISDADLIDLLIKLICYEDSEKEKISLEELKIIENGIAEIIENGVCTIFGSFSSLVRRNGYSDIDVAVSSVSTRTGRIRPLQEIIDNPKCLLENPFTKSEFYTFPQEEIIKAMYEYFVANKYFQEKFEMRILLVRTPIVIFKSKRVPEMKMSFDVSVNNEISVEKSRLLSDFISKDESIGNKMRNVTMFIIHWAKINKILSGAYSDEKLEIKWKFNSYIINQLIIHFVQVSAKKALINISEIPENRIISYNFDTVFEGYTGFLHSFSTYFLDFQFEKFGIFGNKVVEKSKLAQNQGVSDSPLMLIDPLDVTHNISEKVIPDGIQLFKNSLKNSLEKMNQNDFRIIDLL